MASYPNHNGPYVVDDGNISPFYAETPTKKKANYAVDEVSIDSSLNEKRIEALGSLVSKVDEKPVIVDSDGSLTKKSKIKMAICKFFFGPFLILFNGSWFFDGYHYVFMPFIAYAVAVYLLVVVTLVLWMIFRRVKPEKRGPAPEQPESLLLIIPCYNESEEELRRSLDSLVEQVDIDEHPQGIVVVCDGRARGPGMTETTAALLLDTILTHKTSRKVIKNAYLAWDKQDVDVEIQRGEYRGVPYCCIIKIQNSGKRDGLILARSFAWNFNLRDTKPATIFSAPLFGELASFVLDDCRIDHIDSIVGMDADTSFDKRCIYELIKESRYPDTVGVCGVVSVDFRGGSWNLWRLMQHAAYTVSQGLPRLHQSMVTHKVTCLPGCCQLLKVVEEVCGDEILRETFGYCPTPNDSMLKHLRANYSEDRNHVVNMLVKRPKVKTRQAFYAYAWTDVPVSFAVFFSQRKRWSLGATVNDLILLTAWRTQWFERIRASANISIWVCNIFILGSIVALIHSLMSDSWYITVGVLGAVIVPLSYMFCLGFWMPPTRRLKIQFFLGLIIFLATAPFMTISIQIYSLWKLDDFRWGKTRQAITEDPEKPVVEPTPAPVGAPVTRYSHGYPPSRYSDVTTQVNTPVNRSQIFDEESNIGLQPPPKIHI